ncbi:MAG: GNAT family N-acetyltransferase [Promethearchaeota archaeon]
MKNVLEKISSKSINYYIEQNLDDFYIKSSTHPNFTSHLENKIKWVISNYADWPDAIFRTNFENLNVNDEINEVKQHINKGIAPNGWTIGPLTKPKNLGNILEKNGFSNVYHQAGMAIDLKVLKNKISNEGWFEVEKIDDKKSLKQWIEVVSSVFGIRVDFELIDYLISEPKAEFYIGSFKGTPVSSLMLYLSSGVAGLHAVSTLSEYRNRGFGLAISIKALKNAFKMGYKVGVLQASALGERVYKKLGFKKYCDIISYELIE